MLQEYIRDILNDEELIAHREEWFGKLNNLFLGGYPDKLHLSGFRVNGNCSIFEEPEKWMEEALTSLAGCVQGTVSDSWFIPAVIWPDIYGVHFVDKIFGADVFNLRGQWQCNYIRNEVGELAKPDLETNETWLLAKRHAQAFLDADVRFPIFSTPIIASVLNIAINLYGEEILVAMLADPEAAEHDFRVIHEVLMKLHTWYREHIPDGQLQMTLASNRTQPRGHGQICGCSTHLVSAELYERFIMPLDNELLGLYPGGGMIHLCGGHTHLIPLFAQMENLKTVQLNDRASEELEHYVKGLREDQVIYLNLCAGMPEERALEIAGKKRMVIVKER